MTLNQLIHKFKVIGDNHQFINRFGTGQVSDIDATISDYIQFPMLWVIPQSIEATENTTTFTFRAMVFDLVNTDDTPETEVLSDTASTLLDVIKLFRYDGLSGVDFDGLPTEYTINENIQMIPFTERFTDYVSGWYADISIITDADNNPCSNGL
jgi:hypothetical protein